MCAKLFCAVWVQVTIPRPACFMQTVLYIAVIAYCSLWSLYTLCIAKVCMTYALVLFAFCIFNWLAFEEPQVSSRIYCSCPPLMHWCSFSSFWGKRHLNQVHPLRAVLYFLISFHVLWNVFRNIDSGLSTHKSKRLSWAWQSQTNFWYDWYLSIPIYTWQNLP